MKKIILLSSVLIILGSGAAYADISLSLGINEPAYPTAVYAAPTPDWPSYHYDHHRHRHDDYWAHKERAHGEREHGHG